MGITIEDCIKELLINKEDDTYVWGNETIDFAIETMRKYQKIQEIVQSKTTRLSYDIGFRQIKKVVEDGIDDK